MLGEVSWKSGPLSCWICWICWISWELTDLPRCDPQIQIFNITAERSMFFWEIMLLAAVLLNMLNVLGWASTWGDLGKEHQSSLQLQEALLGKSVLLAAVTLSSFRKNASFSFCRNLEIPIYFTFAKCAVFQEGLRRDSTELQDSLRNAHCQWKDGMDYQGVRANNWTFLEFWTPWRHELEQVFDCWIIVWHECL